MFFWILLLSHVLGDFPLQTDSIFRMKTRYTWGVLPHVFICTLMNIIVLAPFWRSIHAWAAILFLTLVHALLDQTKITIANKIAKDNFGQFILDQALHVLSVWIAAFWLSQTISIDSYSLFGMPLTRADLIRLTAIIFVTFGGAPIVFYGIKAWSERHPLAPKSVSFPTLVQRLPGLLERFLAMVFFLSGNWAGFLSVAVFIPRLLYKAQNRSMTLLYILLNLALITFVGGFVMLVTLKN